MMTNTLRTISLTLLLFTAPVWAGEEMTVNDKPSISASRSESLSAVVDAINHETREVTLTGSRGNTVTFIASPDVRNLDQVNVGDQVFAEFYEEINVTVQAADGMEPGAAQIQQTARAEKGKMPGMAAMDTTVITAIVEAINLEDNTFTLKGLQGELKTFTARDPENLKKADVGDLVVITITQAMGIVVEPPPAGE